jgi:signal transduction histidine kinase
VKTGSLRRRVAVSALGLLVVVLLGLGMLVNTLLGNALRSDLRSRLEDRAGYAALLQEQGVTGQSLADKLAGGGVLSTFTTAGGQFVGRPGSPPARRPVEGPPRRPTSSPSISYGESGGQLVATVRFAAGTLTLQTSEADLDRTLAELRRIELLAGAGTVLVAGLLLFVLVGRAMRPLSRMTELARRIRDGARGGRLRPRSPTTDLGRTAAAFDEMLDALEAAERQAQQAEERMRAFLADASHDLRTPLAGVIAGAEQVLRHPGSRLEREAQLVAVVRQGRRASRLVDDLLLMTRLTDADESALSSVTAVDVGELAVTEAEAARLRHPGVHIVVAGVGPGDRLGGGPGDGIGGSPLTVVGDPDRLRRLLANLLDNAAQSGASTVTMRVEATPPGTGSGQARIRVSDDGPGVAEGDRERIFERFVRLDASRAGSGSGLGLPISRAIARTHGGDIYCSATDSGTGACFEVFLPTLDADPYPTPAPVFRLTPS